MAPRRVDPGARPVYARRRERFADERQQLSDVLLTTMTPDRYVAGLPSPTSQASLCARALYSRGFVLVSGGGRRDDRRWGTRPVLWAVDRGPRNRAAGDPRR